jgi:hypothetical protein
LAGGILCRGVIPKNLSGQQDTGGFTLREHGVRRRTIEAHPTEGRTGTLAEVAPGNVKGLVPEGLQHHRKSDPVFTGCSGGDHSHDSRHIKKLMRERFPNSPWQGKNKTLGEREWSRREELNTPSAEY